MIDAGMNLGFERDQTKRLVSTTVAGAAEMMMQEGADPTALRADVTSPSGMTVATTRISEEEGIRRAVYRALQVCYDKANKTGK